MYRQVFVLILTLVLMIVSGCGGSSPNPQPNETLIPLATVPANTTAAAIQIPSPLPSPVVPTQPIPTFPPPTTIPTLVPIATVFIPPSPTNTLAAVAHVNIYMIALNDNGKTGPAVGCGDSVIAVQRDIAPTAGVLTAALKELLSLHDQTYGQSGLYNALYQSDLQVKRVAVLNGTAVIQLTGKLTLGGECDDPRVAAQLKSTALQFRTVRAVAVSVNGVPLEQLLGGK